MPEENEMQSKGNVVESGGRIKIFDGYPFYLYGVSEPKFSEEEKNLLEALKGVVFKKLHASDISSKVKATVPKKFCSAFNEQVVRIIQSSEALRKLPDTETLSAVKINLLALVKEHLSFVKSPEAVATSFVDSTIGYGYLSEPLRDPDLEEVMVNGFYKPVFVFHKKYGMCETNLDVEKSLFIPNLVHRIAATADKKIDSTAPLLDARLPDGSRANATVPYATPAGPSLTIRKFTVVPLSIVQMIENNTLTPEVAAFLWAMTEGLNIEPMNMIISGGAGSGKTTSLNALASFIRYSDRIVSIEDTLELALGKRQNWIQMEAKPPTRELPEVTMDELLKNSLRMRPDRIIVGEVRGKEAQTMFVAMDVGHRGCFGTLHSNNGRELLLRLKASPMDVPEVMIPLLNLIIMQHRMYIRGQGIIRRIVQISEIGRMENKPLLGDLFQWDPEKDELRRTDIPSRVEEMLAEKTMNSKKDLHKEMRVRQRILEWMLAKGIKATPDVEKIIQQYYYDPNALLEKISADL